MAVFKCLKDCYVEEGVEQSYVVLKGRTKTKGEKVIGKTFQFKKIKAKAKTLSNEESDHSINSTLSGRLAGRYSKRRLGQMNSRICSNSKIPILELLNVVWFELALYFSVSHHERICLGYQFIRCHSKDRSRTTTTRVQ